MQKLRRSHKAMQKTCGSQREGLRKCRAGAGFLVRMQRPADTYRRDAKCSIKDVFFVLLQSDFALTLWLMITLRSTSPSKAKSCVYYVSTYEKWWHLNIESAMWRGLSNTALTHQGRFMHRPMVNWAITGSVNALLTIRQQTIIWTSAALIVNWTLLKFESNHNIFIQENKVQNVICKVTAILFRNVLILSVNNTNKSVGLHRKHVLHQLSRVHNLYTV